MTAPVLLRATALTHQGAVRASNQDTVAVGDWIASESMTAPVIRDHRIGAPLISLVADGMGGHAAGEVASRAVAEHLSRRAAEASDEVALAALVRDADAELYALMRERPAWRGMGTTVAGISITPRGLMAFNVGDSRVYRIDDDGLVQLSTDDTPGPKLPDGRTAVYTSSIITQVLGGYGPDAPSDRIVPHVLHKAPVAGARYLICSDGLTDLVDRATIETTLTPDDRTSARALFETAMARGGNDNISLILLRIR
jgi:serine/threonine protein phosphatase PrpC